MKTSPNSPRTDDTANRGIESALAVVVLAGIGFVLDRWLGTTPWLTIVFTIVAAVGVFASMKYRYVESMDRLEAERLESGLRRPIATEENS